MNRKTSKFISDNSIKFDYCKSFDSVSIFCKSFNSDMFLHICYYKDCVNIRFKGNMSIIIQFILDCFEKDDYKTLKELEKL